MSASKSTYFYLRDWWLDDAHAAGGIWCVRQGKHLTLTEAKREAKKFAKAIGKGARVQVVRVTSEVVAEVTP